MAEAAQNSMENALGEFRYVYRMGPQNMVGKLQGIDRVADNTALNIHESLSYSPCFSVSFLS
jgi:hypothetical protein